jgi:hypothetical protein
MFRIKGWASFQSYKDRKPPWIRLHKTLLDNFEFQSMSANARALLPMLWLLASEDVDPVSGSLRDGYEKIAFRLRLPKKEVLDAIGEIIAAGFIEEIQESNQQVTEPLRICYETVTPETETETESNTYENKFHTPLKAKKNKTAYSDEFEAWWKLYPTDSGMSKLDAFKQWQRLTPEEQQAASLAMPAFKLWIAKQGKDYRTVHAMRFLSQKRFEGFAQNGEAPPNAELIPKTDPKAIAWVEQARKFRVELHEQNGGYLIPKSFQPNQLQAAE